MGELKDLFVSYEIARQVKEKGFDESCFAVYGKSEEHGLQLAPRSFEFLDIIDDKHFIKDPTHQQVIDWLREKHNIHIELAIDWTDKENQLSQKNYSYCLNIKNDDKNTGVWNYFNTYYEAINAAIEQALKLI